LGAPPRDVGDFRSRALQRIVPHGYSVVGGDSSRATLLAWFSYA